MSGKQKKEFDKLCEFRGKVTGYNYRAYAICSAFAKATSDALSLMSQKLSTN